VVDYRLATLPSRELAVESPFLSDAEKAGEIDAMMTTTCGMPMA
jgi:hypothetical protein